MQIYANLLKFNVNYLCNPWSQFQYENSFGNLRMSTFQQRQNQQFMHQKKIVWNFRMCTFMQMSYMRFRGTLIKLSLKYIPCSLKRCINYVCILNGYKVMQFWLTGPFHTTTIIYRLQNELMQQYLYTNIFKLPHPLSKILHSIYYTLYFEPLTKLVIST